MKNWLLLLLLTNGFIALTQNQNNTWLFGVHWGIRFDNKIMSVIPYKASDMATRSSCAIISDKASGSMLFYTNGKQVWNKTNNPMRNGTLIGSMQTNALIVENSEQTYFIFYTNETDEIYYAFVDLNADGGLGEVVYKDSLLASGMDLQFTAVKLPNAQGHWFITHQAGTNTFLSYRISNGQISKSPVKSITGTPTDPTFQSYGRMITNRSGTKLLYSFYNAAGSFTTRIEEFQIDKRCGTITIKNQINRANNAPLARSGHPCYDASGRYLYVTYYLTSNSYELWQYDLDAPDPSSSRQLIFSTLRIMISMQLGYDDKIYILTSQNLANAASISVINNPSLNGLACDFKQHLAKLGGDPLASSGWVETFPTFVHDISKTNVTDNPPKLKISAACVFSPSAFVLENPAEMDYDSLKWEFGDGNSSTQYNTQYTYDKTGTYFVKFTWYVCSFKYQVVDTIEITDKLAFSLGKDTTLCNGVPITLKVPIIAQKFIWNTGDTTSEIIVMKPGNYSVQISSGNCTASNNININYHPPLFTALGDEYTVCDKDKELVKLDAGEGFSTYKWTPTEDTSQWIIVGEVQDYFVVVKDFKGCDGSDGTTVKRRCPVTVYFPNSFSPNDDGINDTYVPVGVDVVSFKLNIYNRWGQLVFESNNINDVWNGTLNNKPAPNDTYIYVAEYAGYLNKKLKAFNVEGNITLMR